MDIPTVRYSKYAKHFTAVIKSVCIYALFIYFVFNMLVRVDGENIPLIEEKVFNILSSCMFLKQIILSVSIITYAMHTIINRLLN